MAKWPCTGQPPHFLVQEGHILGHWLYAGLLCHLVQVTHISNGWLLGGRSPPNNQPLSHYKISICLVRLGFGRPAGGRANGRLYWLVSAGRAVGGQAGGQQRFGRTIQSFVSSSRWGLKAIAHLLYAIHSSTHPLEHPLIPYRVHLQHPLLSLRLRGLFG